MIDVAKRTGITASLDEVASLPLGTSEINIFRLCYWLYNICFWGL